MRFTVFFVAVVIALTGARVAYADKDARTLFEEANAHFAVGEFSVAGELYQDAYKLRPDPALLYDAAQSFRLAGNSERALILYKNYLTFYPTQRNVPEVRMQVAKLREAVAAQEKAKTAPPSTTVTPTEPTPPTSSQATRPAEPPPVATAPHNDAAGPGVAADNGATMSTSSSPSSDRAPTPIYKKWWLWTAVGAVVVAGVVVGVVVGTRSTTPWSTTDPIGPGRQALVSW